LREAEAGGSRLKFIFVSPFRRDTSSDLRATKGIRKVARGIGHGRHVGRQKQHRRNHLLCGLIEAVREEMGDADSSQVDCGDGGRRGLQHLQLKAVEEARKHGIDSCRPDARPIERRTYVLISTVQYHWSCN